MADVKFIVFIFSLIDPVADNIFLVIMCNLIDLMANGSYLNSLENQMAHDK